MGPAQSGASSVEVVLGEQRAHEHLVEPFSPRVLSEPEPSQLLRGVGVSVGGEQETSLGCGAYQEVPAG